MTRLVSLLKLMLFFVALSLLEALPRTRFVRSQQCSVSSPITSTCTEGGATCERVMFDDSKPARCPGGKMVYTGPGGESAIVGSHLRCDADSGRWSMTRIGSSLEDVRVEAGGNVRCVYADCGDWEYFPACGADANCVEMVRDQDHFECPDGYSLWTTDSADKTSSGRPHWAERQEEYLTCRRGQLVADGKSLPPGTQARCREISTSTWWHRQLFYIVAGAVILIALLALITLGACICCCTEPDVPAPPRRARKTRSEMSSSVSER